MELKCVRCDVQLVRVSSQERIFRADKLSIANPTIVDQRQEVSLVSRGWFFPGPLRFYVHLLSSCLLQFMPSTHDIITLSHGVYLSSDECSVFSSSNPLAHNDFLDVQRYGERTGREPSFA